MTQGRFIETMFAEKLQMVVIVAYSLHPSTFENDRCAAVIVVTPGMAPACASETVARGTLIRATPLESMLIGMAKLLK